MSFMKFIERIPVPICAVALGVLGLGNLLQPYSEVVRVICGIIGFGLQLLFIIGSCANPAWLKKEMQNPVSATVSCTFPMGLMILSTYIKSWAGILAVILWWVAVALHICIICYVVSKFVVHFKLSNVFTTWFICFVGLAAAAMTSPVHGFEAFGAFTAWFGIITFAILLVVVTLRYIKHPIATPAQPLICIYAAPANLSIVGYIATTENPSLGLLMTLWVIGFCLWIFGCVKFVQYFARPFYHSHAAYTFPFVISATASVKLMECAASLGTPMPWLGPIAIIQTIVATVLVTFVVVRYLMYLFGAIEVGVKKAA